MGASRRVLVLALLAALALLLAAQLLFRSERLAAPARAAPTWALAAADGGGALDTTAAGSTLAPVSSDARIDARIPLSARSVLTLLEPSSRRFVAVGEGLTAPLELRLRAANGASGQFELWGTAGGGACATPPEVSAANGSAAFALRSRRNGQFVRARLVGREPEGSLTADVRWWPGGGSGGEAAPFPASALFLSVPVPLEGPDRPRAAPNGAAELGAGGAGTEALGGAGGCVRLWSCGSRAFVGAQPDGPLRAVSGHGSSRFLATALVSGAAAAGSSSLLPPFRVASVDYHIGTAQESGGLLRSFGLRFDEHSLSGACARTGHCAASLRPLTRENGFTLCPRPHALRRAFFAAHRAAPLVTAADAFICSHPAVRRAPTAAARRARRSSLRSPARPRRASSPPARGSPLAGWRQALCELWLPFNRSLLVLVTANLELARENPQRWRAWLAAVRRIAADRRCLLAANSAYDQAYVRHFARVRPLLLPSLAPYVDASYAPAHASFLLAPAHSDAARAFLERARALCAALGAEAVWLREAYPEYTHAQLGSHRGVVLLPYTKSVMSTFELYRMGVPLFAPSLRVGALSLRRPAPAPRRGRRSPDARASASPRAQLLTELELSSAVMSERIYWTGAPAPPEAAAEPSPNTRSDRRAVERWLALSDHLLLPHVQLFDSAEHLAAQLAGATDDGLAAVSARMVAHLSVHEAAVRARWAAGLARIFRDQRPGGAPVPPSCDGELRRRFNLSLSREEPDCLRRSAPDEGRWE